MSDNGAILYRAMEAIESFSLGRPSDFGLCSPEQDLGIALAYLSRKHGIEAWDSHMQAKEIERQRAASKK